MEGPEKTLTFEETIGKGKTPAVKIMIDK